MSRFRIVIRDAATDTDSVVAEIDSLVEVQTSEDTTNEVGRRTREDLSLPGVLMADTKRTLATHAKRRRDFLKMGAGAATVAPGVGLLLQAGMEPAYAQASYSEAGNPRTSGEERMIAADLNAFVVRYHEALDAFFGGNPEPAKRLFSHKEDTTLGNPFGPFARGWPQVEGTMDRAAANYSDGGATGFETLSVCETSNLAYLVEVERFAARIGGSEGIASGALRVTTVLRPEDGNWKIVHRHADPITTPRPADSVIQR